MDFDPRDYYDARDPRDPRDRNERDRDFDDDALTMGRGRSPRGLLPLAMKSEGHLPPGALRRRTRRRPFVLSPPREESVARPSLIPGSWNEVASWLHQIDGLRQAA